MTTKNQNATFPKHTLTESDDELLYDLLHHIHKRASHSISHKSRESELYYFVTLCGYESIHTIHIIEYCILNYPEITNKDVINNIKILLEIIAD